MGDVEPEPLTFEDAAQWESWLAEHHELDGGVWLKIAKKNSGVPSVTPVEADEVALCYGWIDSHRRGFDDTYFLQRFSRRRPRSSWSKVNVERVEALIAAGRMREPGLAEIRAARADGRWDRAYESQAKTTVPPDLAAALKTNEAAGRAFAELGRTDRYLVILRLLKARDDADRERQLAAAVARLENGEVGGGGSAG